MDLINRQDAIDVADRADYTGLAIEDVKKVTDEVVKGLKRLPSAQPEPFDVAKDIARIIENEIDMRVIAQSERKKGEWLETETSYADGVRQKCRCSVCSRLSPRPLGDFCRWCGADMRGEEDE